MAKRDNDLFERMRDLGVRKSRANKVAKAVKDSPKKAPKPVRNVIADLEGAVAEIQGRVNGSKAKRKAAAKKAAQTRKLKAKKRSDAAKKAAKTRAKATA